MKTKFSFLLVLLLTLVIGAQPAVAKKPLTTIAFDGAPEGGFSHLDLDGVTFDYPNWGTYGAAINYEEPDWALTIDGLKYIDGWYLGAEVVPENLVITFDKPTTVVEFGFAIPMSSPTDSVLIDLYQPGHNKLRESVVFTMSPSTEIWREEQFIYRGPAINKVVISFPNLPLRYDFRLDNLTFQN